MSGMEGFYGGPYQAMHLPDAMDQVDLSGAMDSDMMGDTLDDIIDQNNQEMQRRRTIDASFDPNGSFSGHGRRASMMEFGTDDTGMGEFGFDPAPDHQSFTKPTNNASILQKASNLRKSRSKEDMMGLSQQYSPFSSVFESFQPSQAYSSPDVIATSLSIPTTSYVTPNGVDLPLNFSDTPTAIPTGIGYPNVNQQPVFTQSPLHTTFPPAFPPNTNQSLVDVDDPSDEQTIMEKVARMPMPGALNTTSVSPDPLQATAAGSGGHTPLGNPGVVALDISTPQTHNLDPLGGASTPFSTGAILPDNLPIISNDIPIASQFPNAYSASGFDMLGILMRVAGRKKPEINIGPVDLSCAFVVCDITQHDMPIVYCSEVFERLTGYSKHEILGRNCRFLQAPNGRVQAGVKRKYVDDKSVLHLKNKIARREEVQLSLINYRKGGQPFMNLLTMIPVPWDNDEYKYYVGFQVDLVEHPGSVAGRNPDGSYAINYQRGSLPRYVVQTPENHTPTSDLGQTVGRDEVSTVLSTIAAGESELSKRIWDKALLENTDDVVHVLSLKGLFLYLSPACKKVLEYDASELVGTALSSVCHPSDIVPVTRELKDTSSGTSINVVFRIRRKNSGYTWFESHGSLHTEQGKGRKCIILVGRQRPVYALLRPGLDIGDSDVWSKISTSGIILFVASNVRVLLDRLPEDLIGTSIQALMRPESRHELGRALEQARVGKRTSFKHDLQNRRGQILQAQTLLFPGDAEEGYKPTFLVAQTRLLKMSRMNANHRTSMQGSPRTDAASVGSGTPGQSMASGPVSRNGSLMTTITNNTSNGSTVDKIVMTNAGGEALAVGNQDEILASEDNIFDELKTTRSSSWQFELRQMEKQNRVLSEELQGLISRKKKRKRRKGAGQLEKDCANCHTRVTPEWRRGPSGNRDLCNSCGLRWAKQNGRVSPRKTVSVSDGSKTPNQTSNQSSDPSYVDKTNVPSNRSPSNAVPPNGSQPPVNRQQTEGPPASASAPAPKLDAHIAKTAKFGDQNLQGKIGDRHILPLKIDEDIEPPSEDDGLLGIPN